MSPFRRENPHPLVSDAFDLVARYAHLEGKHLSEEALSDAGAFMTTFSALLDEARKPHRIHGRRAEEMFSYVVAALGAVRAIKREDAGELTVEEEVGKPDFRLIMRDGQEFFVEVKNCNQGFKEPFEIPLHALIRLRAYGEVFARPIYLAIYWARGRFGTIHSIASLIDRWEVGTRVKVLMADALKSSEMYRLGDIVLGTVPPLTLRMSLDAELVATDQRESSFAATITGVELFCGGRPVTSEREKRIALDIMLHGEWNESGPIPIMQGGHLSAVEYTCEPEEFDPSLGFAVVAALSRLHSAHFNALTVDDEGKIRRLHPTEELPPSPYPAPSEDYRGEAVKLWRLVVRPAATAARRSRTRRRRR